MKDSKTIRLNDITEEVIDRLEALLDDDDYSESELTIIHGAIFFILAGKQTPAKCELLVDLARGRAEKVKEELKKQNDEADEDGLDALEEAIADANDAENEKPK